MQTPDWYPKREDIPLSDDALRALKQAWLAVHVIRFEGTHGPDGWYGAINKAQRNIAGVAGLDTFGYSYGWVSEL
jgi:hypothetical protein